jgi:hypothetical protein
MNPRFILLGIFVLLIFLGINSCVALAYQEEERIAKATFDIQVFDVDLSTDTAEVNISIKFTNLFIEYLQPRENITAIISSKVNLVEIKCNRTAEAGVFVGCSGIVHWYLEGELGKGEYFPFEIYELVFRLANILPGPFNMSRIELDTSYSFISFEGAKKFLLARIFGADENGRISLKMSFRDKLTAIAYLSRKTGSFDLPILFWPTILPTLTCFYVLVSTLWLTGEKSLENRLMAYISLFIFCPSFLMAMQGYLPLRASLSIPEMLLVSLLISTSIFTIGSFIPAKTVSQELARDGAICFSSTFSFIFFSNQFMPLFPASAYSTFLWAFAAHVLTAFFFWSYRYSIEILKPPNDAKSIFLGIVAWLFIFFSFIYLIYLALAPFEFTFTITALWTVSLLTGLCFLQYRRRYRRRVWYWFFLKQEDSLKSLRALLSLIRKYIHIRTKHKSET